MKKYKVIKAFPNQNKEYKVGDIISEAGSKGFIDIAKDWPEYFEEIPEFRLEIENGKIITDLKQIIYVVNKYTFYTAPYYIYNITSSIISDFKIFETELEANEYIRINSKRFSVKDIEEACDEVFEKLTKAGLLSKLDYPRYTLLELRNYFYDM